MIVYDKTYFTFEFLQFGHLFREDVQYGNFGWMTYFLKVGFLVHYSPYPFEGKKRERRGVCGLFTHGTGWYVYNLNRQSTQRLTWGSEPDTALLHAWQVPGRWCVIPALKVEKDRLKLISINHYGCQEVIFDNHIPLRMSKNILIPINDCIY